MNDGPPHRGADGGATGTGVLPEARRPVALPTGAKRLARILVPNLFVLAAISAAVLTLPFLGIGAATFNHHYVAVPLNVGIVPVGQPIEVVPFANVVVRLRLTSLSDLSQALNPGVLTSVGSHWTLQQPVIIASGTHLTLRGPGTLVLAPGSFLEISQGGSASLTNLAIQSSVGGSSRGFLFDSGGALVLNHDEIRSLGRLATFTTGITFANAVKGSGVLNSVVTGNTDGVYVVATSGILLEGNVISASVLDGIYLRDQVSNIVVQANSVTASGLDNLAVEDAGFNVLIAHNTFGSAMRYGVLLYNNARPITIRANRLEGSIDGVVVNATSRTKIVANIFSGVQRFGIRLSGRSIGNEVSSNRLDHCAVGVYLTSGATKNSILMNRFVADGENIRIRLSAPRNVVRPRPSNSEIDLRP